MAHSTSLALQGVWTSWKEHVYPLDLSWKNLIYGPGPKVIAFILNSMINSVKTPDMLKLWGYTDKASCPLCNAPQCTIHHILANCKYALEQKRYTWRHDSVLANIERALARHIADHNIRHVPSTRPAFPHISKSFVQSTRKNRKTKKSNTPRPSLLDTANDWMMLVDYDKNKIVFPPMICATSQRPDIVVWSSMARTVIIIELTCPAEEGIQAAAIRKESRYAGLLTQIEETKSWSGS